MITALAGGVGAAKLLWGLAHVMEPRDLSIIINTGDDIELFGLAISPDLDIVTYTLAGLVNPQTGWGLQGDTFACLESLLRLTGEKRWFNLGDRDLATHLYRTALRRAGVPLARIAADIAAALHVRAQILPMCDEAVPTTIVTAQGAMHLQEYLVKYRAEPVVQGIRFEQIDQAKPAPGVAEAILQAEAIIICPSNPLISINPILAVPGLRDLLKQTSAPILAISPIVGGQSLKGPSDRMLRQLGYEASALQVAQLYADFLDGFIVDALDVALQPAIAALGLKTFVTNTVMRESADKVALARFTRQGVQLLR